MTIRVHKGDTRWSFAHGMAPDGRGWEYEIVDGAGKVVELGWTSGSRADVENEAHRALLALSRRAKPAVLPVSAQLAGGGPNNQIQKGGVS